MLLKPVPYIILIAIGLFFLLIKLLKIFWSKYEAKWNEKAKNKWLREKAKETIMEAIDEYFPWHGHGLIRSRLGHNFFEQHLLAEPSKFQSFADQLLKLRAKALEEAFEKENTVRESHKALLAQPPDSVRRREIERLVYETMVMKSYKEKAKEKFWELHNVLGELGFKTFGAISYKLYLLMEARPIEATISFL